jgi:hypothetical protein
MPKWLERLIATIKAMIEAYIKSNIPSGGTTTTTTTTESNTSATDTVTPTTPNSVDDLDLNKVATISVKNCPGVTSDEVKGAKVTGKISEASISGDKMYFSYGDLGWPSQGEEKKVNAVCCIFYATDSGPVGGKFDYLGVGQTAKTLDNLEGEGYGGITMPPHGRDAWAMFFSLDGSQRTNTKRITWK